MIAQPEPLDTDLGMSPAPQAGYAAKKRSDHLVGAVRPSLLLAPDSPRPRPDRAPVPGAEVIAMPAPRPRRDGTARCGAIVPLDDHNRVFATKPLAALGWGPETELVAEVRGNTAIVRAGVRTRTQAWLLPTGVDKNARLRLPPGVKGALQVRTGEPVVLCAVPATGELHVSAAADVLQALTGQIDPEPAEQTTPAAGGGTGAPRTRVRAAVFTD